MGNIIPVPTCTAPTCDFGSDSEKYVGLDVAQKTVEDLRQSISILGVQVIELRKELQQRNGIPDTLIDGRCLFKARDPPNAYVPSSGFWDPTAILQAQNILQEHDNDRLEECYARTAPQGRCEAFDPRMGMLIQVPQDETGMTGMTGLSYASFQPPLQYPPSRCNLMAYPDTSCIGGYAIFPHAGSVNTDSTPDVSTLFVQPPPRECLRRKRASRSAPPIPPRDDATTTTTTTTTTAAPTATESTCQDETPEDISE